jgi:hypothetical protein
MAGQDPPYGLIRENWTMLHRRDPFDAAARRLTHRTQVRGGARPEAV